MFYNARYYSPLLGRFISADTIVPNPANPQGLNRFAYASNNPVNRVDPSGHKDCEKSSETGTCQSATPEEKALADWQGFVESIKDGNQFRMSKAELDALAGNFEDAAWMLHAFARGEGFGSGVTTIGLEAANLLGKIANSTLGVSLLVLSPLYISAALNEEDAIWQESFAKWLRETVIPTAKRDDDTIEFQLRIDNSELVVDCLACKNEWYMPAPLTNLQTAKTIITFARMFMYRPKVQAVISTIQQQPIFGGR